ncbi:hypothetical protein K501DRAFT_273757 [Backusella circina FSU 941]|nr:hypothetical protein K501DRAFT_280783 [Backusella circina FSU 941]KAI8882352.1 hypothetical protein K501DRAFT_273757 [Backusella circina FSU 941]
MLAQLRSLKAGVDSIIQVFIRYVITTNMTTLEPFVDSNDIFPLFNLDWPLFIFPSLKSLIIDFSSEVVVGKEIHPERVYPNLEILTIRSENVDESLFDYINTVAPNLRIFMYKKLIFWAKPGTPKTESGQTHHEINLTGLKLDMFGLPLDLDEDRNDMSHELCFEIKTKTPERLKISVLHNSNISITFNHMLFIILKSDSVLYSRNHKHF